MYFALLYGCGNWGMRLRSRPPFQAFPTSEQRLYTLVTQPTQTCRDELFLRWQEVEQGSQARPHHRRTLGNVERQREECKRQTMYWVELISSVLTNRGYAPTTKLNYITMVLLLLSHSEYQYDAESVWYCYNYRHCNSSPSLENKGGKVGALAPIGRCFITIGGTVPF